jgi:ABC-type uncharacterized transport system auxiliary subunit
VSSLGRRAAALALLAALPLGAGCRGLFGRERPAQQRFLLEAERPDAQPAPPGAPELEVRPFTTSSHLHGRRFVYRLGPDTLDFDYYHEFWAEPGRLVTEAVIRWLARAGLFAFVAEAGRGGPGGFVLDGELTELYGDYRDPRAPRAVLRLRCALLDEAGGSSRVVLYREYEAARPVAAASREALVAGWNEALREILAALEQDLAAARGSS